MATSPDLQGTDGEPVESWKLVKWTDIHIYMVSTKADAPPESYNMEPGPVSFSVIQMDRHMKTQNLRHREKS